MDRRSTDRLIACLIGVLAIAAAHDAYQLWRDAQVNRGLAAIAAGEDVAGEHPRLRFARAYALQETGKFEGALEAYAAIDAADDDLLQAGIDYNLANLYLRRAFEYRETGADDLALPMVELAKEYYRGLLRETSGDWSSKYNLELALRIAPETELEDAQEERNPEHNPRSAAGIQVRERLP